MNEQGDLVRLLDFDSDFVVELKYSTPHNFTGQKIYDSNECYINKNTASLLIAAKNIFKSAGYSVKVWDAYRPISAQEKFYEILPDPNFVAIPPRLNQNKSLRANHLNGLCVDITLIDAQGEELEMPSMFDDFSERASLSCADISDSARKNASYMKSVMESVGFEAYDSEWWHFYDRQTPPTPFLDFPI